VNERNNQEKKNHGRPPRNHAKRERVCGEEATWCRPTYQIVEASMEMSAYFLATR
jgi:hypothetical protein